MKNTVTEIKLTRNNKEINIFDIINFIKNNTNSFEVIKSAILKATNNKAIVTPKKVIYNNSTIIIGISNFDIPIIIVLLL